MRSAAPAGASGGDIFRQEETGASRISARLGRRVSAGFGERDRGRSSGPVGHWRRAVSSVRVSARSISGEAVPPSVRAMGTSSPTGSSEHAPSRLRPGGSIATAASIPGASSAMHWPRRNGSAPESPRAWGGAASPPCLVRRHRHSIGGRCAVRRREGRGRALRCGCRYGRWRRRLGRRDGGRWSWGRRWCRCRRGPRPILAAPDRSCDPVRLCRRSTAAVRRRTGRHRRRSASVGGAASDGQEVGAGAAGEADLKGAPPKAAWRFGLGAGCAFEMATVTALPVGSRRRSGQVRAGRSGRCGALAPVRAAGRRLRRARFRASGCRRRRFAPPRWRAVRGRVARWFRCRRPPIRAARVRGGPALRGGRGRVR